MTRWATLVAVVALIPLPGLLPVLPPRTFASSPWAVLNEDALETIGWPQVVQQVRGVVARTGDRDSVVVAENYGEAGALQWYGVRAPVYSGHNGYGAWGPPADPTGPVVWVGFATPFADQLVGCRKAVTLRTGVDNEEDGKGVWVCRGPAGSWGQAWTHLRHYSA